MSNLGYRDLIAWQRAMEVCKQTYLLTQKLPVTERFGLSNQMQRAAVSIPSNIAEGQTRKSRREFLNFLSIALGSKSELETQLQLCSAIGFLTEEEIRRTMELLAETGKLLTTLYRSLDLQSPSKTSN